MKNTGAGQSVKSKQQPVAKKSRKASNSLSKPTQLIDHSSFIYFSRLPAEIRLEIWRFVLTDPFKWRVLYEARLRYRADRRRRYFRFADVIQKDEKKVSRLQITPNNDNQLDVIFRVSLVCHESRYEALRMASLSASPDKFIVRCPSFLEYWMPPRKAKILSAIGNFDIPSVQHIILTGDRDALYYEWKMLIADPLFLKLSGLQTLDFALERKGEPTKWTLGRPESRNTPRVMVMLSKICRQDYAKVHSGKLLHVDIWLPRPC